MNKKWKYLIQDDNYRASNFGDIQTKYTTIRNNKGMFESVISDKWLDVNQFNHSCGYLVCNLKINGGTKMMYSHRIIASTFLHKANENLIVNHKNGDKKDNRVENLEWVTHSENHKHAFRTGIRKVSKKQIQELKKKCGEKNATSKLKREEVIEIKRLFKETDMSNEDIGGIFDVSRTTIYQIRTNNSWKHI